MKKKDKFVIKKFANLISLQISQSFCNYNINFYGSQSSVACRIHRIPVGTCFMQRLFRDFRSFKHFPSFTCAFELIVLLRFREARSILLLSYREVSVTFAEVQKKKSRESHL